jgi:hypothetical protein
LDQASLKAKTSIEHICHSLAEKIARRGMICLISDLFVDVDGLLRGLQHFRHRDHEVMVIHVLDKDELDFDFQGNTQFRGLENTGRLTIEPRALRKGYLEAVERFCADVKRKCVANQIGYKLVSTGDLLDAALLSFLAARAAARRKAGAKR